MLARHLDRMKAGHQVYCHACKREFTAVDEMQWCPRCGSDNVECWHMSEVYGDSVLQTTFDVDVRLSTGGPEDGFIFHFSEYSDEPEGATYYFTEAGPYEFQELSEEEFRVVWEILGWHAQSALAAMGDKVKGVW